MLKMNFVRQTENKRTVHRGGKGPRLLKSNTELQAQIPLANNLIILSTYSFSV